MVMTQKESKFMQPMQVSEKLAAVIGRGPMPRTEVTKKLWEYIKAKKCQNPSNKRNIVPDKALAEVFGSGEEIDMFEMTRLVSSHLS
jgi:chromatin remodeling complex protein RSC6